MGWNTHRWNRIRYGLYAHVYDPFLRALSPGRQIAISQLNVQPHERVLIIGGGTGLDFEHLPETTDVVLTDISPVMVAKAEKRRRRLGLENTRCQVMNAQALELPDQSFDVVVLHLILAVVPDGYAAIQEASRVLKKNGRMSIYDKFVHEDKQPGWLRNLFNHITESIATNINRSIEPMLTEAGLSKEKDTPVHFNGFFRALIVKKSQ